MVGDQGISWVNKHAGWLMFLLMLSFLLEGFSQETKVTGDLQLWTGLSAEKQLVDEKLELYFDLELRMEKDVSQAKSFYGEFGAGYSFLKQIKVLAAYRIGQVRFDDSSFGAYYRYHFDLNLKHKIVRFTPLYRFRFQNTDDDFFKNDTKKDSKDVIRNKLQVKYNINKSRFSPFLSTELFTRLKAGEFVNYKLRSTVGSSVSFKEFGRVKFFYRLNYELNDPTPYIISIIGIRYKYVW